MATIRFTQCDTGFKMDGASAEASLMPIIPRMKFYESILSDNPDGAFCTIDEHFVLVAQWMRRNGTLAELDLVSVCSCSEDYSSVRRFGTDQDGDMLDDPHHGFFPQRLKYLR